MAKIPGDDNGSLKNTKLASTQQPYTIGRQQKDFEYGIYGQTSFQAYKNEYFVLCQKIRSQRLVEHLGRYKSNEYKINQINIFKSNFLRIKQLLLLMSRQAEKYKSLTANNTSSRNSKCNGYDSQISFKKKIRKQLKDIDSCWVELFVQGSLKRLVAILVLLKIPDDQVNILFDMTQWHIETEYKFMSNKSSQGCCCV